MHLPQNTWLSSIYYIVSMQSETCSDPVSVHVLLSSSCRLCLLSVLLWKSTTLMWDRHVCLLFRGSYCVYERWGERGWGCSYLPSVFFFVFVDECKRSSGRENRDEEALSQLPPCPFHSPCWGCCCWLQWHSSSPHVNSLAGTHINGFAFKLALQPQFNSGHTSAPPVHTHMEASAELAWHQRERQNLALMYVVIWSSL